jgi:hypothetical protein
MKLDLSGQNLRRNRDGLGEIGQQPMGKPPHKEKSSLLRIAAVLYYVVLACRGGTMDIELVTGNHVAFLYHQQFPIVTNSRLVPEATREATKLSS